jgi:hypothetical protein
MSSFAALALIVDALLPANVIAVWTREREES